MMKFSLVKTMYFILKNNLKGLSMIKKEKIYVRLLNEGINVSRPISARLIKNNVYEILEENKEINSQYGEIWEFNQYDMVECVRQKNENVAIKKYKEVK